MSISKEWTKEDYEKFKELRETMGDLDKTISKNKKWDKLFFKINILLLIVLLVSSGVQHYENRLSMFNLLWNQAFSVFVAYHISTLKYRFKSEDKFLIEHNRFIEEVDNALKQYEDENNCNTSV